jgi:hypothetical protein
VRFFGDTEASKQQTLNAETADAAEKKPENLCDLSVLCVKTS